MSTHCTVRLNFLFSNTFRHKLKYAEWIMVCLQPWNFILDRLEIWKTDDWYDTDDAGEVSFASNKERPKWIKFPAFIFVHQIFHFSTAAK